MKKNRETMKGCRALVRGWSVLLTTGGLVWANPPLTLDFQRGVDGVVLEWEGDESVRLESSASLESGYAEVEGATSPWRVTLVEEAPGPRFYRVKQGDRVSDRVGVVQWVLEGPAHDLQVVHSPFQTDSRRTEDVLGEPGDDGHLSVWAWRTGSGLEPVNEYLWGSWWEPDRELSVGQGFIAEVIGGPMVLMLVGRVPGEGEVEVPEGHSLVGSPLPRAGRLVSDLGFPVADGDTVYTWDRESRRWRVHHYSTRYGWPTGEPRLAVGEALVSRKREGAVWRMTLQGGEGRP